MASDNAPSSDGPVDGLPVDIATGQKLGAPLSTDELMALAEITIGDMADAAVDWDQTSGMPGLLDAKTTTLKGKLQ